MDQSNDEQGQKSFFC